MKPVSRERMEKLKVKSKLLCNRNMKRQTNAEDTLPSAPTHNLFLIDVPRAVGGGEGGGAGLAVPGDVAVLRGAADGQSVNAVGVAVAVTVVLLSSSIPRGPHEYGAQTATTLRSRKHSYKKAEH